MSLRRQLVAARALACLLALPPIAFGQGAEPHVPDPISTIRLHRLLDGAIGPRDARWAAIETAHDLYLSECRPLREGRVETLLPLVGSGGAIEDPQAIDLGRQAAASMAAADDRLFVALAAVLGEESSAGLAVARDRRTRDRLRATMANWSGVVPGDGSIGDLARRSITDQTLLAPLEPALRTYERKATSLLRRAVDSGLAATEDGLLAVRDSGLPAADPRDPANGRRRWETFRAGAAPGHERTLELLAELRSLDRAAASAIFKKLPFQEGRAARFRIERAVHGAGADFGQAWIEMFFQLALRSPDLDAEARAAALDAYREWAAEDDAFFLRSLAADAGDRATAEADGSARRKVNERWTSRLMNESTPWTTPLRERWMALVNGRRGDQLDPFDPDFVLEERPETRYVHSARWSPRPLVAARVDRLADRLRLDDEERASAHALHLELAGRWSEAITPLAALVDASEQAMQRVEDGRVRTLPEGIEPHVRARLAVLDGVAALDGTFYDDLRTLLGDRLTEDDEAEIELSRLSRAMERLGTGDWAMYTHPSAIVRPVDPVAVIDGLELTPEERGAVRRALLDRREAFVSAASDRARVQAGLEATMQANIDAGFAMQRAVQEAEQTEEERKAAEDELTELRRRSDLEAGDLTSRRLAADRAVRAAFGEAIAGLSEANRQRAEERYERRAVPEYFADPRAPWTLLDRALRLRELDTDARDALAALRDESERRSTATAVAFGDLRRTALRPEMPVHKDVLRRAREAALCFDRDENSARTVGRLRRLLAPGQQELVDGLDDYERRVERVRQTFIRFVE